MFNWLVPQMIKMLKNLDHILDKGAEYAAAKNFDMGVLLNTRLAPDQFNLIRQVQIACDVAKFSAAKLTNKEAPEHADKETNLAELKTRIQETIKFLGTFTKEDFNGSEERKISQPRWEGKYLNGLEYAIQYTLPNVYFHVTTTYSILRNNGVEVGKKDFLGEMPYKK
jgi:hypothetical protein